MRLYAESKHTQFKYAKGKTDIYGKTFHDSFEIFLLLSGNTEYISDRTRLKLKPYQLVVIEPGRYHQFCIDGDADDYERLVININPTAEFMKICNTAVSDKEIMSLDENHRIVKHFIYLKDCISGVSEADFPFILDAVATDIMFLIKNSTVKEKIPRIGFNSISASAMEYINSHFNENFTIESLAKHLHISSSSLSHIFKADFGISIKKYILQKRMNAAHYALKNGKRAEEAAFLCGYTNYSAFYRSFVGYFGYSPSDDLKNKN